MTSSLRRLLVPLLRSIHAGKPISFRMKSAAGQALFLVQRKPSPSRKKPAQKQREATEAAGRLAAKARRGVVYRSVAARAPRMCECGCEVAFGLHEDAPEMDHFYGRQYESRETCWMLRRGCHRNKTENRPTRALWDAKFAAHCFRYGFVFRCRNIKSLRPAPAAPPTPPSGERSGAGQEERDADAALRDSDAHGRES